MTLLALLAPATLAVLTGGLALLAGERAWRTRAVLAGSLATSVAGLLLAARVVASGPAAALGGWLHADGLSALVVSVCALAWPLAVGAGTPATPRRSGWRAGLWDAGLAAVTAAALVAAISGNLGLLWVALEAGTIASALLVGHDRGAESIEAAWKYLVLCSVGIALALFATVLLYYSAVPMLGRDGDGLLWRTLLEAANGLDVRFVRLAFLFALVGYGTKAGLAPMHSWVPDAYSRAPGPAAALLSSALGAASIAALLRFAALARATVGPEWTDTLLALFGVASMVVAVPFLVAQEETARLFAWSSVKHTGLVVLAVGLGTPMALFGGLFHLLAQACAKPLAFLVVGECTTRDGTRRIEEQRGLWARDRRLGVWMLIALAGAAGLPPAAGFVSQWLALVGGFTGPRPAFALVALAALAVGFLGLVRHGARLLMGAPAPAPDALPPVRASWAMGVAAMLLVGLGLGLPEAVRALIESAMQAVRP